VWIAVLGSPVLAGLISLVVVWAPWRQANTPAQDPVGPGVQATTAAPGHAGAPKQGSTGPGNQTLAGPDVPVNRTQSVFVNPTSGAGGIRVTLSGEGFPANAHVVFNFHTEQFAEATTNGAGKFSGVSASIPRSLSQFARSSSSSPRCPGPSLPELRSC
jgi:hypothetical protein